MIVMTANNTGAKQREIGAKYPGRVGLLLSPGGWRRPHGPYALDNGAFPAWMSGEPWAEGAFLTMLDRAADAMAAPRWVLVPDVVADRSATLRKWDSWAPLLQRYGWPLAFAIQDGMEYADVPKEAAVLFIGGSTRWKWRATWDWCRKFPRVHVGRVNSYRLLWNAHDAGAESCDGTGWFRGDQDQLAGLERYLEESTTHGRRQERLLA